MRWVQPRTPGIILGLTVFLVLGWALFRAFWPAQSGYNSATADVEGIRVTIIYKYKATEAMVSVRLNGLGKYQKVAYEIVSSAPMAPSWNGTIEGTISEYLVIQNGFQPVEEPMTAELAAKLARSYKISLKLGGEEPRTLDFSNVSSVQMSPP